MKNILMVLILSGFNLMVAQPTPDQPLGSGTALDPYQIATIENLYWISSASGVASPTISERYSAYYIQTAIIDASGFNWTPIGTNGLYQFTGSYNGQDHKILNITISSTGTAPLGLFGWAKGAVIENLGVQNVNITGNDGIGGLVGYVSDLTQIINCWSTGTINGGAIIGGLIGQNVGSFVSESYSSVNVTGNGNQIGGLIGFGDNLSEIDSCYSSGNVVGASSLGGLVGNIKASIINNCYNAGNVNGTASSASVGGLVGFCENSEIDSSYNTGNVDGVSRIGGLVGNNDNSTLRNSFSTGAVSGTATPTTVVGGIVGWNQSSSEISNCYSRGDVSGIGFVGGLVGNNHGSINDGYSTGNVSGTGSLVGGLTGNNISAVSNSFWDTETSTKATSSGGIGKTTAEMKTNTTFLSANWDSNIWNIGDGINDGYPYLAWQNPNGTKLTGVNVSVVVFLEGSYSSGTMSTSLNGTLPTDSPYAEDPRSVTSIPADVVDWALLELRDKNNSSDIIASRSAFILKTGQIVDLNGVDPVNFLTPEDDYFIAVKHRNHLKILSSNAVAPL